MADAPIDVLLPRSEDLAKGWLLALLEQAPLDEAPGIMAGDLTRDGPRVCEAVLRALADDTDLRRLEPGGALTPLASHVGELAGAAGPETTSRAVEALHGVIWTALRDELRSPEPELVSQLAERLALVAELLRSAALRRGEAAGGEEPTRMRLAPQESVAGWEGSEDAVESAAAEREDRPDPSASETQGDSLGDQGDSLERAWPAAGAETPALWIGALEEEIRRSGDAPLSLVLAELEDAARVAAVETTTEASAAFGEFAQAVRGVVRRQDILVRETDSRAWIIARDTGRGGAQTLGSRIADAVRERRPWRGAALTASVGVAVLGEDGRSPEELIDAAEEARFAAAANGVSVIHAVPDESSSE